MKSEATRKVLTDPDYFSGIHWEYVPTSEFITRRAHWPHGYIRVPVEPQKPRRWWTRLRAMWNRYRGVVSSLARSR